MSPARWIRFFIIFVIADKLPSSSVPWLEKPLAGLAYLWALSEPHPFTEALRSGLQELGYMDGRNITILWRYADLQFSKAVEHAAEFVRSTNQFRAGH